MEIEVLSEHLYYSEKQEGFTGICHYHIFRYILGDCILDWYRVWWNNVKFDWKETFKQHQFLVLHS